MQITVNNGINDIAFDPLAPFRDIINLHGENPRRQVEVSDRRGENQPLRRKPRATLRFAVD
ncbi:MAG: hypothetical protein ACLQIB_00330 [Isosphaeraceae bacterium]